MRRHAMRGCWVVLALGLAACEPSLNVEVSAAPAAESSTAAAEPVRVTIPLEGIELRRTDSSTYARKRDLVALDFTTLDGGASYSLLNNEKVTTGSYEALRLLIDDSDAEVQTGDGGLFPLQLNDDAVFAPVSFKVKNDSGAAFTLLAVLDLRLSLKRVGDDHYELDPVLRAVQPADAAEVRGTVAAFLLSGADCTRGAAVYAFQGKDITPDERDGDGVEPYATATVGGSGSYRLRDLPAGDYTLALTCDAEREDGIDSADPEMEFGDGSDITLDDGETLTFDIDS